MESVYSAVRNGSLNSLSFVFKGLKRDIALVAATRELGLEVSADKTKYMVMSRDQNARRSHSLRIDNSTFERVEDFKYLGTNLTHQNSIPEESFVFQVAIQKFKDQDI